MGFFICFFTHWRVADWVSASADVDQWMLNHSSQWLALWRCQHLGQDSAIHITAGERQANFLLRELGLLLP